MAKDKFLSSSEIEQNIKLFQKYLTTQKMDAFYVSSFDIFLNEYVPLEDCHRYYVTNFTGSTAEAIVPKTGRVLLFVDGRYYEQADLEVDAKLVEVIKVPYGKGLQTAVKEEIIGRKFKTLGLEGDRIDLNLHRDFSTLSKVTSLNSGELHRVLTFKTKSFNKFIHEIPLDLVGMSTKEKCQKILKPGEAFFISALDSIAWLTNLRRFELPYQSTFRAKALATSERVYLLLEAIEGEVKNESVEISVGSFSKLEDFLALVGEFENFWSLKISDSKIKIEKVYFSDKSLNAADFEKLKNYFGENTLVNRSEGLTPYHALKNPSELHAMESSFNRGDQAIFETINWVKNTVNKSESISELDFYHKTNEFYKKNGALDQSFKTIAALGPNSSIIHFSNPSEDVSFRPGELTLLDSGGYFESGYATDTTRSFLSGGEANERQKEIYTTVLKAILHTMNAVFPEGTWGSLIDGICRQPIFKAGLNYNHGTGHGVGINVHEGGFRLSTTSNMPLKENTVGSIEPGIYIPGFGGVRLENVVVVERHPVLNGMLRFRSLVYVGFDHELINEHMLTDEEKRWLEEYERECQKRGRSFKYRS
jgi:Xaa-Pro aminopeptidase